MSAAWLALPWALDLQGLAGCTELAAIDDLRRAERLQVVALFDLAGRRDDTVAESRQHRDGDAADAAGRTGHQHIAIARLQPMALQREHAEHRGVARRADGHCLAS